MDRPALIKDKKGAALSAGPSRDSAPDSAGSSSAVDPIAGLDDILGFHIRLAHGAVYRHFSETFASLDLTQKQVSVLWLVDDSPGISQIAVGRQLHMDRATTMTIVKRLQERGYLRREKSTEDGRKQQLYLKDEGKNALKEAKTCIESHESWLKSRFSAEEIEKLVEMLKRIHD